MRAVTPVTDRSTSTRLEYRGCSMNQFSMRHHIGDRNLRVVDVLSAVRVPLFRPLGKIELKSSRFEQVRTLLVAKCADR